MIKIIALSLHRRNDLLIKLELWRGGWDKRLYLMYFKIWFVFFIIFFALQLFFVLSILFFPLLLIPYQYELSFFLASKILCEILAKFISNLLDAPLQGYLHNQH